MIIAAESAGNACRHKKRMRLTNSGILSKEWRI